MSDTEMSRDGDSPDALSRVPPTDVDPDTLEKLKQQVRFLQHFIPFSYLRIFFSRKLRTILLLYLDQLIKNTI